MRKLTLPRKMGLYTHKGPSLLSIIRWRQIVREEIMLIKVLDTCIDGARGSAPRSITARDCGQRSRVSFLTEKLAGHARWLGAAAALILLWITSGSAAAQTTFDPATYKELAPASSSESIPVGTRIDLSNWTAYKKFLPLGIQTLFSQKYLLRMGNDPGFSVEEGDLG
jgi:hypothetical protein